MNRKSFWIFLAYLATASLNSTANAWIPVHNKLVFADPAGLDRDRSSETKPWLWMSFRENICSHRVEYRLGEGSRPVENAKSKKRANSLVLAFAISEALVYDFPSDGRRDTVGKCFRGENCFPFYDASFGIFSKLFVDPCDEVLHRIEGVEIEFTNSSHNRLCWPTANILISENTGDSSAAFIDEQIGNDLRFDFYPRSILEKNGFFGGEHGIASRNGGLSSENQSSDNADRSNSGNNRLPERGVRHPSLFTIISYVMAISFAAACFINMGLTLILWGNGHGFRWLGVWRRPILSGSLLLGLGLGGYGLAALIGWSLS